MAGPVPALHQLELLSETVQAPPAANGGNHRFQALAASSGEVQVLAEVQAEEAPRDPSGSDELDRVLGGGLVRGAVILIGGDPALANPICCCKPWPVSARGAGAVCDRRRIRPAGGAARLAAGGGRQAGAPAGGNPPGAGAGGLAERAPGRGGD